MILTIDNKSKQETFVAIFQLLKNWSSHINMNFEKNKLFIQAMDKSHVCLANIEINCEWFTKYECIINKKISVDSTHFAIVISYALKNDIIELTFEDENDPSKLYINFLNIKEKKSSYDHFFELNLIDVDEDSLGIPVVDYDVEFIIESKKFVDILSELNTFGSDLIITCREDIMELNVNGDTTKLKVNIPVDDLNEYAISEGEELNSSFSLSHLCKMCLSVKLSSTISISLSTEYPMSLAYDLGNNSKVSFFIAPKIMDN